MLKKTKIPLSKLSWFEKLAVSLSRINNFAWFKRMQFWYSKTVTTWFARKMVGNRIYLDGITQHLNLQPSHGVVFVGNHRTFFDLGFAVVPFCRKKIKWSKRITFPVRSNFFYEHPAGLLLNFLVCAGFMYPPIFRDPLKKSWNKDALQRIIQYLSKPGSLMGFHPEGGRSKEPDPYTLLPAKSGIGEIILHTKTVIIPFFVRGLSNSVWQNFKEGRKKDARRTSPIIIVYGESIDCSEFQNQEKTPALYKQVADHVLDKIKQLMEREKELRSACLAGEINDTDAGWSWV